MATFFAYFSVLHPFSLEVPPCIQSKSSSCRGACLSPSLVSVGNKQLLARCQSMGQVSWRLRRPAQAEPEFTLRPQIRRVTFAPECLVCGSKGSLGGWGEERISSAPGLQRLSQVLLGLASLPTPIPQPPPQAFQLAISLSLNPKRIQHAPETSGDPQSVTGPRQPLPAQPRHPASTGFSLTAHVAPHIEVP